MSASLSAVERLILEAVCQAEADGAADQHLTDVVRHLVARLPGHHFRNGVARLATRRLLTAEVTTKISGEVGRVAIHGITPLGRYAAGQSPARTRALPG